MTKPRMFVWRSSALANYAPGHIIVVASSVEEARRFAALELNNYIEQRAKDFFLDVEDQEEMRALAVADLEREPEQMMSILIRGSE